MTYTQEQIAENRRLWVEGLRSGLFEQTTGVLTRTIVGPQGQPVGHCCLGVACVVLGIDISEENPEQPGLVVYGTGDQANSYLLPEDVASSLGINSTGQLNTPLMNGYSELSSLNDEANYSFADIADVIEDGDFKTPVL